MLQGGCQRPCVAGCASGQSQRPCAAGCGSRVYWLVVRQLFGE